MTQSVLGAHIPWALIDNYLTFVLELALVPEIAIKGPELDDIDGQKIQQTAALLLEHGVRPRIHAPFFDLNPGALDPLIRQVTMTRLSQTLDLAKQLDAHLVVIHPGVDKWRYPRLDDVWLHNALQFFPGLIDLAANFSCQLAIENIYEETPETLVKLVNGLDSPYFGHCFDAGHWHLFGRRPMPEWLDLISDKLFHLHLHDNHGRADEHLPLGKGTIDFTPLQEHLSCRSRPPSMTLEAHNPDDLKLSLLQSQVLFFS